MKKIPTAHEFWMKHGNSEFLITVITAFAKLHVEAALKAAAENVEYGLEPHWSGEQENAYVDRESILNAYPLTNIK